MGIQGLASLIDKNQKIYRDVKFRRRRLVIDGQNLLYLLYFNSGLDLIRGGEYAAFEELVERFCKALKDCRISPYIVLDGGSDVTHKKDETVRSRVKDRIKAAHRAAEESKQEQILPQLAKFVFKQTLARLEVPMAVCYGEADQEVATLAKEWECPVLSNDSDFYIFDLPGGLLPISHFKWEEVQGTGSQSYIPCKFYRFSSFCIVFEIKPQLLPVFAVLAGNDYVKLQRMQTPIHWTQFAQTANGAPPNRLEGLLCWLRDFQQPEEAFEAALGLMGQLSKKRKAEVREYLDQGMEEYQLRSNSLKRFFLHGVAPPFPEVKEMPTCPVPDWALLPLTQARLTADILDVLLLHSLPLSCPVDLKDKPSSNLTSRPIRQVIYWLLLGGGEKIQVFECDRDGLELTDFPVRPAACGVAQDLRLQTLDKVDVSVRLQVLLETLGVSEDSLGKVQPHLRLLVATTCYWLQRAKPSPDETLLKALLLGVTHVAALRQRAEKQVYKQKLDPDVSHTFNQWQGCLKQSIHLNQLLGRPLLEPRIAQCYEGSLVHKLVHMMRTEQKLKPFLKSNPTTMTEYHSMLAVTQQFQSTLLKPSSQKPNPGERALVSLKDLFYLYEEEEVSSAIRAHEDLSLDELLSIKTRYRVKKRSRRSNSLMLACKQEGRSWDILWAASPGTH